MIIKLQNGNILKLSKEESDYLNWRKLSPKQKQQSRINKAKAYLNSGPNITNFWNAFLAYIGNKDPKNPHLSTGEPSILPGRNPIKGILNAAKAVRTLEDYLKTTKVTAQSLEGSSAARSAYATDRYLGGVMFENNLPKAASQIQGHGMAKASTLLENLARLRYILDNGLEKGKTFFTAPLKVSDARVGSALGTGGGKPYFDGHFLITGKPGLMINSVDDIGTIYINDAYENKEALKAAQKVKEYLTKTYPNKVFKLYSEGFKKGGSIKTANARKWKHKDGGKAFVNGVSVLDSNPDAYKYVKKKYLMALEGTKLNFWLKTGNFLNSGLGQTLMNGVSGVIKTTAENKNIDAQAKAAQAQNEADWAQMMNLIIKQNQEENNRNYMQWVSAYQNGLIQDLPSLIVAAHMGLEKLNQDLATGKQNLKNKNSQINSTAQAAKSENWTNTFGSIVQQGMGTIGLLIGNNTNSRSTNSKTNFGTSDYKLQLPEIWNHPTLYNNK